MRTPRAAAAFGLACVLVLGGCSDDGEPRSDPTRSPTATPSPAASSTSPAASESLTVAPPNETARQFIRRWVALGNQMQATGETEGFLAVAGPDCTSCHDFAKQVRTIYANGGMIEAEGERVTSLRSESSEQWVVTTDSAPTRYRESADGPLKRFPGGVSRSRLYLAQVDGRWIVGATESLPE